MLSWEVTTKIAIESTKKRPNKTGKKITNKTWLSAEGRDRGYQVSGIGIRYQVIDQSG